MVIHHLIEEISHANPYNISLYLLMHNLYLYLCTAILCIIFQVTQFIVNRRKGRSNISIKKMILVHMFIFYLSLVYDVTSVYYVFWRIWETGVSNISLERIYLIPFTTVSMSNPMPYLLNILMTIPLGFLLPVIWPDFRSLKKVTFAGFLFSLTIEITQLFTGFRLSCTDDLIANTLGAAIGYFMFKILFKIFSSLENKSSPALIKHEAAYYLMLSFIGAFIFYTVL